MIIDRIKKNHLCLGCGLCASVIGHKNCKMEITDDGFYVPTLRERVDDKIVKSLCPGIRVHGNSCGKLWGVYYDVSEGWANDEEIRFHSSSGGVVSALAVYLLQEHIVDAILHVGVSSDNYLRNELKVSRNKEDIINNAQSRYAPALTLYNIKQLLDNSKDVYGFVGKACDIAGLKNLIEIYPQYKDRFKLFVSIICAGMPSMDGTQKALSLSGRKEPPRTLKYRGDGWPGLFMATWDDGTKFHLTYRESWGKILGGFLNFRCKICADGIGSLADISIGDSWNTKDGYPDFEEQDGRCLIFTRTVRGQETLHDAKSKGYIEVNPITDIDGIKYMQPGQYSRRKLAGWRIFPVQLMTMGMLNFRGLGMYKQAVSSNYIEGLKNMKGTLVRFLRILRNGNY